MCVPVHLLHPMDLSLFAMELLEKLLNTPVEVATTWWVLALEHVNLVVTGQKVLQPVKKVEYSYIECWYPPCRSYISVVTVQYSTRVFSMTICL